MDARVLSHSEAQCSMSLQARCHLSHGHHRRCAAALKRGSRGVHRTADRRSPHGPKHLCMCSMRRTESSQAEISDTRSALVAPSRWQDGLHGAKGTSLQPCMANLAPCTWAAPIRGRTWRRSAGASARTSRDSLSGSGDHRNVHCTDASVRLAATAAGAVGMVGCSISSTVPMSFEMQHSAHTRHAVLPCRRATEPVQDVASDSEDRILETLKKIGAHVDSAVGALSNLSRMGATPQSEVTSHWHAPACKPCDISWTGGRAKVCVGARRREMNLSVMKRHMEDLVAYAFVWGRTGSLPSYEHSLLLLLEGQRSMLEAPHAVPSCCPAPRRRRRLRRRGRSW